tara:strand:+ start:377 stop:1270 length:894 start_codon:yes stop_codon:yes gene_type:complete
VLFCYIHIYYHLKTSNDLEIYTVEQPSKDKLEEICNLRQPMMFSYENTNIQENCSFSSIRDKYIAFDLKIRKTNIDDIEETLYLPLPIKECDELFKNDKSGKYFTEKNKDFLDETGVVKQFRHNDMFLRPPLVSNCKYDIWSGSINTCTPLRYFLNFRNYLYVTDGEISIKLIPPKSSRYLYVIKDYDNFEFRSPINPWDVQKKYLAEFRKVNVLEITLKKGDMLFIPAYWWYSLRYDKLSSISVFHYRTYMNTIAILPEIFLSLLQQQNTKCETTSKMSFMDKANASVTHFLSKIK